MNPARAQCAFVFFFLLFPSFKTRARPHRKPKHCIRQCCCQHLVADRHCSKWKLSIGEMLKIESKNDIRHPISTFELMGNRWRHFDWFESIGFNFSESKLNFWFEERNRKVKLSSWTFYSTFHRFCCLPSPVRSFPFILPSPLSLSLYRLLLWQIKKRSLSMFLNAFARFFWFCLSLFLLDLVIKVTHPIHLSFCLRPKVILALVAGVHWLACCAAFNTHTHRQNLLLETKVSNQV